jgi:hypothetical protein
MDTHSKVDILSSLMTRKMPQKRRKMSRRERKRKTRISQGAAYWLS